MKPAGLLAEKLLAENQRLKAKAEYFELKIKKLNERAALNESKAASLIREERKRRKYKVE